MCSNTEHLSMIFFHHGYNLNVIVRPTLNHTQFRVILHTLTHIHIHTYSHTHTHTHTHKHTETDINGEITHHPFQMFNFGCQSIWQSILPTRYMLIIVALIAST